MESHHLVKSPILLGARKPLRRYLSTDSRRGGARLLEEEETCAICSPILFVHSRIIRLFFAKILSCQSLVCMFKLIEEPGDEKWRIIRAVIVSVLILTVFVWIYAEMLRLRLSLPLNISPSYFSHFMNGMKTQLR